MQVKDLDPISEPLVANVSYDRDSELTFEVGFDIRPEITLSRLGGFRFDRPEVAVSEEQVDEQLELLRRQQALWKPVERRAAAGDTVQVMITPLGDEEAESQSHNFVLGEGRAIPDVEEAIVTLDLGACEEFSVTFPDDVENEERRGATQRLRIELKQVLEQELPALDDGFAQSVGDFADFAALREAVTEDIRHHMDHEAEAQLDQRIVEHILDANHFDVPDSMIERYVNALIGPPPEDADPELVDRAREQARPAAEWGIKRTLIIQQVAEDHDLEATKEEVQERLQTIAKRAGKQVGEIRARLAKTGELRDLERRITEEKVFEYLREQSEISAGGS